MAQRANVVGTGLIGASIGLAARAAGHAVAGADADEAALSIARERGAVDEALPLAEAGHGAERGDEAVQPSVARRLRLGERRQEPRRALEELAARVLGAAGL